MGKITQAQLRRIFVLARERGLDNELLHTHLFSLTGRESLKELTITEAVKLIDSLEGKQQTDRITKRQLQYIEKLCKSLGWLDAAGAVDKKVLNTFIERQYAISRIQWMSVKQASKLIEGLKKLLEKDKSMARKSDTKSDDQTKEAKEYEENTY